MGRSQGLLWCGGYAGIENEVCLAAKFPFLTKATKLLFYKVCV